MQFKQYPSYKPSGVEWLGDVPEHWDSCNLKFISKIYAGGTPDRNRLDYWVKGEIPWINSGAVNQVIIKEPSEYITELGLKNSSAKYIPVNSLVMALAGQGKTKGMVAYTSIETTCNQSMAAIVPKNYHYKFLYYWLDSNYQNIRNLTGGDNRDGLNLAVLSNIPCPKISIVEQTQIVSFLDTETARIDNLIAKQEKLIELLEEQRKSIISHAVTKGLNPNAPMKDSGVEWLGEVPESWVEQKIKFISKLINEKTSEKSNVIALENIESWTGKYIETESSFESDAVKFKKNDVLFGKLRPYLAKVYLVQNQGEAVGDIYVLRPNKLIHPQFLKFFMLSEKFIDYVNSSTNGTKMPRANWDFIGCISIFLPHIKVQHEIVEYLESAVLKIELIINKQISLIEKLKEYRSSIISHAVTGKIDVREFGA